MRSQAINPAVKALIAMLAMTGAFAACDDDDDTTPAPAPTTTSTGTSSTTGTGGETSSGGMGGMGASAGGAGGMAGAMGGTGGGGGGEPSACASYCADEIAVCTGPNAQYAGPDALGWCEGLCEHFAPGNEGDDSGDSLACRVTHTELAAENAALHCVHSGPYGGAVCGASQCDVFCGLLALVCVGANENYAVLQDCLDDCEAFADATESFMADPASTTDSLACRGYHLAAAAAVDPDVHCMHTGGPNAAVPSTICVD